MPILKIVKLPSPILRKKSAALDLKRISSRELKSLISSMLKTMVKSDGVGLAAPQVGKNMRLAVINSKDGAFCLINPKITKKSFAKEPGQEGCLSVPGVFGQVKRNKKITLTYLNEQGKKIKFNAQGMMARVIQHELDHLDGILFIDKATKIEDTIAKKQ
ncbi:MAG: peptide deformylase [bacterium]|nr:peptide deformylase [bacterium]